jgi:hypothetical protein
VKRPTERGCVSNSSLRFSRDEELLNWHLKSLLETFFCV